jgi:hypothetical protein
MAEEKFAALREGMSVVSADEELVGEVLEVFRDIGLVESFGELGIPPQQEGHNPANYAYSEAMPGAGDSYLTMKRSQGGILYVPFSALSSAEGDRAVLAVDAESIPDMSWDVRPDVLAGREHEYPLDGGADPKKA